MLNNFPRYGKTLSIILIIIIGFLIYLLWSDPKKENLKPGSNEYYFIHYNDTLGFNDTNVPTVIMHYWFKDSNNIWHEDNEKGRTDSSEYKKNHK